jgi:5-methylcytosine-specific restriction protein A
MPFAAKRPCSQPGCSVLLSSGSFCDKHRKQEGPRPTANSRGYGARWQKERLAFIYQQFALGNVRCADCECLFFSDKGIEVDHIVPHRGNQQLFWDRTNWQMLCHECHSRKTLRGD